MLEELEEAFLVAEAYLEFADPVVLWHRSGLRCNGIATLLIRAVIEARWGNHTPRAWISPARIWKKFFEAFFSIDRNFWLVLMQIYFVARQDHHFVDQFLWSVLIARFPQGVPSIRPWVRSGG